MRIQREAPTRLTVCQNLIFSSRYAEGLGLKHENPGTIFHSPLHPPVRLMNNKQDIAFPQVFTYLAFSYYFASVMGPTGAGKSTVSIVGEQQKPIR